MARQHVHNRRAGSGNTGASWISYSDIMAALLLVFVLFLVYNLYIYNSAMEAKQLELDTQRIKLDEQAALLDEQQGILIIQQGKLEEAQTELEDAKVALDAKETELQNQTIILIGQQKELEDAKATLAVKETDLANMQALLAARETALNAATELITAQQEAMAAQTQQLDSLVGVRTQIIQELSAALSRSGLKADVDPATGDIVLESSVFFDSGKNTIKDEGKVMLDRFLPVYLGVLLRPEYADYLGEIIIEGHTDSDGTFINNLELSQNRALSVAKYCLNSNKLTWQQRQKLQTILTAKGRSSSDLIYFANGQENKDASRRVEFKFSLRDADMINQIHDILNMTDPSVLNQLGIGGRNP